MDSDNTPAVHDVALNHCYRDINNGVYRAGFATSQEAYDKAVHEVFAALDRVCDVINGNISLLILNYIRWKEFFLSDDILLVILLPRLMFGFLPHLYGLMLSMWATSR